MKIVVIGGVAAGTKAAAKIKREDRSAQVEVYTKSRDISYAGCGLPYYVGGGIESREELIVNTPAKFSALTGVDVFNGQEAVSVDTKAKTVQFRSVSDGSVQDVSYDKLVIATGAYPIVP
ncbi:MAG: FAD-dependent oxidoreductase, partial [Oscillospiraceae bacterium]|nr:FAD-dependent oxidoreductase [Oscillospiraceae bacterium]